MPVLRLVAILATLLTMSFTALAQNAVPTRVRGEIAALDGNTLVVRSRDGASATVKLTNDWVALQVSPVAVGAIKKGSYIGAASLPQADGSLKAEEIVVFPEFARGTAEGHFGWDLLPQSTMTNANVDAVVTKQGGRTLTVSYKGGNKTILVPKEAAVVTFAPADRSVVVPGAFTVVFGSKAADGTITAKTVTVGKDGAMPPN